MRPNEPAFPIKDLNDHPGPVGMTLRDYFAAKAMQSILRNLQGHKGLSDQKIAEWSYESADAMLSERDK